MLFLSQKKINDDKTKAQIKLEDVKNGVNTNLIDRFYHNVKNFSKIFNNTKKS
jgi:hypothetical protein